jgi:hypothetical protein
MEFPQRDVGIGWVSGYVRAKDGGSCDAEWAGDAAATTGSGVRPPGKPSYREAEAEGRKRCRSVNGSVTPGGTTPTGAAGCRNNSAKLIPPKSTPIAKTSRAPSTGTASFPPSQESVIVSINPLATIAGGSRLV